MSNESTHVELARYLPLVEGSVVEEYRKKNKLVTPIALVVDEYQVAAGITNEYKAQFEGAVANIDIPALERLKGEDESQYLCGILLLVNTLMSQKNKSVASEIGGKDELRGKLTESARGMIKKIPEASKFLEVLMQRNVASIAPKVSLFISGYSSQDGDVYSNSEVQSRMLSDFKTLPPAELSTMVDEVVSNLDTINRLAYWKATVAHLLTTDGRIAQGLEGVRTSGAVDFRASADKLSGDNKSSFILENTSKKLRAISFINNSKLLLV